MAVYSIGDKVTVQFSPRSYSSISKLNGHVLTVNNTVDFGTEVMYSLRWEQEDNLGRECDFLGITAVLWSDEDLIPCFNTPVIKTIKGAGLPDV